MHPTNIEKNKLTHSQAYKDYQDFKLLVSTQPIPKSDYYISLIKFRKEINRDIQDNNQTIVAEELGVHQTRLSAFLQILKYLDEPEVLSMLCPNI